MSSELPVSSISRRGFLQATGALIGTLAISSFAGQVAGSTRPRVGLIVPESGLYPQLALNLAQGLQLGLMEAAARPVRLLVESYDGRPSSAAAAGRRLLTDAKVDLLVGAISQSAVSMLHPLIAERRTPLIAATMGANPIRPGSEHPYVFQHTLNYWEASFAAGAWAAAELGRRAYVAMSFYESGFAAPGAFIAGFESAGGTVVGQAITHSPTAADDLPGLMRAIDQARPDLIYAAYSGAPATDFLQALAAAGRTTTPLVGSAFLTTGRGPAGMGLFSPLSWAPGLDTAANRQFHSAYRQQVGRAADPFALLGYDTARLLTTALSQADPADRGGLVAALTTAAYLGPRGMVTMDPGTRSAHSDRFLRRITFDHSLPLDRSAITIAPAPHFATYAAARRATPATGWLSPYMAL